MSGRPSLSSSERSSLSRASIEAHTQATIPEERTITPTDRRTASDHAAQIDQIMAKAAEFTPGILTNLRKQTNDVFYSLKEDDSADSSHKQSMLSLSTGPITPDSLSTGIWTLSLLGLSCSAV